MYFHEIILTRHYSNNDKHDVSEIQYRNKRQSLINGIFTNYRFQASYCANRKKVRESRNRPSVAQRFRFPDFMTFGT